MNRETLEERAALLALGLLDEEEARSLIEAARRDEELRQVLSQFLSDATVLGLSAPEVEPPASLRQRVLDQAASLPQRPAESLEEGGPTAEPPAEERPSRRRLIQFLPWALAACLALVCVTLLQRNRALSEANSELIAQSQLAELQVASLRSALDNRPEAWGVAIWDERAQRGKFVATNLPPTEPSKQYQLWVVDPRYENPVDGGVFSVSEEGEIEYTFAPDRPVEEVAAFAVSLERRGGVPVAEGPMVLVGE